MTFFEKIICVFTTQKYFNAILSGLKTTVCITFFSVCIGLVIGTGVAFVKVSQKYIRSVKWLQPICDAYIAVIRGTPLALQLFIMAFAVLAIRDFPLEITAIITFGINSGAYIGENLRAGIQSVDVGQIEAGQSLGLKYGTIMFRVVLPQAVKNVIPAIGNELIALLKETSIVSMVGLIDLTFAAKIIGAGKNMSDYLVPMLVVACFYLAIVYLITLAILIVENDFPNNVKTGRSKPQNSPPRERTGAGYERKRKDGYSRIARRTSL